MGGGGGRCKASSGNHRRELGPGGLPDAEMDMVARRDVAVPNKAAQAAES